MTVNINSWFERGALQAAVDSLLIILVAFCLQMVSRWVFSILQRRMGKRHTNLGFLRTIVKTIIIILAVLGILYQIKPIRGMLTSLLAGSGIAALFIALASQQSLSNFVSGLLISTSKPFAEGDRVKLRDIGITANVEQIGLMHTRFRAFDNSLVVVPNSVLDKVVIENTDLAGETYCSYFEVAISTRSDLGVAMELIRRIAEEHPLVLDHRSTAEKEEGKPKVTIRVTEIEKNGVRLKASIWAQSPGQGYEAVCDIRKDVLLAFQKNGIELPWEQVLISQEVPMEQQDKM